MKVKALFAGVLLAMGAGSANAMIQTSALAGSPSELLLSMFDNTAQRTYLVDLGGSYENFRAGTAANQSWNLASLFGNTLTDAIAAGNDIRYNVVAYGRVAAGTNNSTFGYLTTSNQSEATLDNLAGGKTLSAVGQGASAINLQYGNLNGIADNTSAAINASFTTTDALSTVWYPTTWGNNINTKVGGLDNEGTVGVDLAFWHFGAKLTTTSTLDADVKSLPGKFKLNNAGLLTYTSAVPVPAAVWMMGSALVGLIGFRRRAA